MIGIAAYATIVAGLFISLWRYPAVALAGVLCMFGLEQWGQATTTFFAQQHTVTNIMIGGMLVLALGVQGVRKGSSIFAGYPPVGWLTFALFVYAFASTQWAPRSDISLNLWANGRSYLITFLVLSPLIVTETKDLRSAYTALLLIGGTLSILLLFFVKWETRRIVLDHGLGNPLTVAAMAGMVVLIAILADPWPQSKLWLPCKWVLVALCLALVVRSGSRGQLLGVIVLSAACWPLSRRIAGPRQFIAWVFYYCSLLGSQPWHCGRSGQNKKRITLEEVDGTSKRCRAQCPVVLTRLCIYFGFGTVLQDNTFWSWEFGIIRPTHTRHLSAFVPLEILAEEGLIGIILFLLILSITAKNALRCYRHIQKSPSERPIFAVLVAMFLYTLLLALKQGNLLGNLELFMFGIVIGKYDQWRLTIRLREHQAESQENSELKYSADILP